MENKNIKINISRHFNVESEINLIDFLASKTPLSKALLKKIAINGGVWLKKKGTRPKTRVRRSKTILKIGDLVEIYYKGELVFPNNVEIKLIKQTRDWGIWYKPSGVLTQGTKYGDEGSLLREVEKTKKEAYLIHRLDRETAGPVVIAYNKKQARYLSELFRNNLVQKKYKAEVFGLIKEDQGSIHLPIEGKNSHTNFKVIQRNENTTVLEIELITGRKHQIRRHFEAIGHPVMGDPIYGKGNKNKDGLKLECINLQFKTIQGQNISSS